MAVLACSHSSTTLPYVRSCPVLMIAHPQHLTPTCTTVTWKNVSSTPAVLPREALMGTRLDSARGGLAATSPPGIVYYYGPAESDGTTLTLLLDGVQGDIDRRPIATLSQAWGAQPPQLLFCICWCVCLARDGAEQSATASDDLAERCRCTRRAPYVLEWLHAVLEGDEDTDPVWALHQYGLPCGRLGAYSTWHTRTANEPPNDALSRLLLDRKAQRALSHDAVSELVRDGERRLCCVLAYGAEGNLVELFAEQLYEHLRRLAKDVAQVRRVPPLPATVSFEVRQIEFELRRHLGLSDRDTFGAALTSRKPRGPGRTSRAHAGLGHTRHD